MRYYIMSQLFTTRKKKCQISTDGERERERKTDNLHVFKQQFKTYSTLTTSYIYNKLFLFISHLYICMLLALFTFTMLEKKAAKSRKLTQKV